MAVVFQTSAIIIAAMAVSGPASPWNRRLNQVSSLQQRIEYAVLVVEDPCPQNSNDGGGKGPWRQTYVFLTIPLPRITLSAVSASKRPKQNSRATDARVNFAVTITLFMEP